MEKRPRTGPRPNIAPLRLSTLRLGKNVIIAHLCEFRIGFIDMGRRQTVARRLASGLSLLTVSISGHPLSMRLVRPMGKCWPVLDLLPQSYTI
jgi:hypothetical protein